MREIPTGVSPMPVPRAVLATCQGWHTAQLSLTGILGARRATGAGGAPSEGCPKRLAFAFQERKGQSRGFSCLTCWPNPTGGQL